MAINTIYQTNKSSNKSYIFLYALIVLGLLASIYFGVSFYRNKFQIKGTSALLIDTYFDNAQVYVDDEVVGDTPVDRQDLRSGEHKITVRGNGVEYEVTLNMLPNTQTVLKRDVGSSKLFSAGQNFWFEKRASDAVLSVISDPNDAEVVIDGSVKGKTPFTSTELSPGDYDLELRINGYEPQKSRIEILDGYKLNVSVSMFPLPVPADVALLEGSSKIYDVHTDNTAVASNPADWIKAIIYWNETRGIKIKDVGVNKEKVFDFYVDASGNLYNGEGVKAPEVSAEFIQDAERGAYLRRSSDGPGVSAPAKETIEKLGSIGSAKKAKILETGLGWLRVRDTSTLSGKEISRVNTGGSYDVLDQKDGWVKIKISETLSGWVSDSYVSLE